MAFLAGCAAADDSSDEVGIDVDAEETVAVAQEALSDSQGLGQFFANRQSKPALSVSRGIGTPLECAAGQTWFFGTCSPSGAAPTCPAGKEEDTGLCYDQCPLGYHPVGPLCWLGTLGSDACAALYNSGIAAGAKSAHRARTFGIGAGVAAGASASVEAGVFYGENGEYGCYTSTCGGAVTDVSLEVFATFGDFTGLAALTGDGFDLSVGAGYGVAGYTQSISVDESGNVVGFVQQASLGAGVSPIAIGVSSCDTTLTTLKGPDGPLVPADAPDPRPGNTFYRVAANGTLQMSHHAANGQFDVVNKTIGWGWDAASKVFAAEGGHVYAIVNGTLRYYHHDSQGGWDNWGTDIGTDWGGFVKVFAGRFGEIYAISPNGDLRLYKHNSALVFENNGPVIGTQWNVPTVFSGGHGALYIIDGNGDLVYYYHDENNNWIHQAMHIGTDWDGFVTVGSTGNGELYGVTSSGGLQFYRHDVDKVWASGSGMAIGSEWSFGSHGLIPASY